MTKMTLLGRGVKYYEPEFWKFGEEGNKYFRHATGQIYAISKDLAAYISINAWVHHLPYTCPQERGSSMKLIHTKIVWLAGPFYIDMPMKMFLWGHGSLAWKWSTLMTVQCVVGPLQVNSDRWILSCACGY